MQAVTVLQDDQVNSVKQVHYSTIMQAVTVLQDDQVNSVKQVHYSAHRKYVLYSVHAFALKIIEHLQEHTHIVFFMVGE